MTGICEVCPKRPRGAVTIRFVLAIACAAAFCGIAAAQGGGWAAVEGISPDSRVEVRLSPHGAAKGTLASVSASGLDIQKSDGSIRHIARAQAAKVYLVGKSHKLRDGLIGAGAGIAGGAALVYAVMPKYGDSRTGLVPNDRAATAAAIGLVVGAAAAVVGAVIGLHHSKTLVYQREPDTRANPNGKGPTSAAGLTPAGPE